MNMKLLLSTVGTVVCVCVLVPNGTAQNLKLAGFFRPKQTRVLVNEMPRWGKVSKQKVEDAEHHWTVISARVKGTNEKRQAV
jgi:hypothetical protein